MATESEEMIKLREQVRLLNQKNEELVRENSKLKKLSVEKVFFASSTFVLEEIDLLDDNSSEVIEMCGVKVSMHTERKHDNDGAIFLWFQFNSPTRYNATISCRIKANSSFQKIQFVDIDGGTTTRSTPIILRGYELSRRQRETITADVKFGREARKDILSFDSDRKFANVQVEEKIFKVNVAYISAWSEFFPIYFASDMKEAKEEVFGIEDCTAEQFKEMLDVISPFSKPIDRWNVMYLIEMAERFIMPSLRWKCECFFTTEEHNFSDLELFRAADLFGLVFTKNIVLDRTTEEKLRKVKKSEEYKTFSEKLQRDIEARYLELDVTPREQPSTRNLRRWDDPLSVDDEFYINEKGEVSNMRSWFRIGYQGRGAFLL